MNTIKADLCVIGGGSAGLSLAAGAVQLGLSVVLFEKAEMGGDCLNVGCVPSKALIAAAARAQNIREANKFGVDAGEPRVSWPAVRDHIKGVIATIAPIDSQERFEGLGVTVVREAARFADHQTIISDTYSVRAKRIVIATGSRPFVPPIPGIEGTPYLTNETIFDLDQLPRHLIILGAGPIGAEMGQAFRRLGAEVTLLDAKNALGAVDPEAAAIVLDRMRHEGVNVLEHCNAESIIGNEQGVRLRLRTQSGEEKILEGSHLLVAVGRKPALDQLDLDVGGVAFDKKGVTTSATLRSTTNKRVWALGDAAGGPAFTHIAGWHASAFVRNVLFKARTRADAPAVPSVTFTDPEIAQIGLTEAQARAEHGDDVKTTRWTFEENDRAQAQRDTEGFCKIVLDAKGAILGATIVGAEAGEILAPLALAMSKNLKLRALTDPVLPYPIRAEIVKRAASAHFTPVLFSDKTRALISVLKRIP